MSITTLDAPATGARTPLRAAMEARDLAAVVGMLAPDVVLRSPAVATPFVGRDVVAELLGDLLAVLEELEYTDEIRDGDTLVLVFCARVAGRWVEAVDVVRLDPEGRLREIVVYGRPLAGSASFVAAIGPRLARRHGRIRGLLARVGTRGLPALLAGADALGTRIARPGVR